MKNLHVGIVIPCLNEEDSLLATAISLGFGGDNPPPYTFLVLVDNGSTDNTLQIAKQIQATSPKGRVLIGQESIRGYIPPRHRGNMMMRKLAKMQNISESDVLILQADADTLYSNEYANELRQCSMSNGHNVIVEACSQRLPEFVKAHPQFVELCDKIDEEFETLLADHPDDVILDDKTCGYRLSDYFFWGAHRREFTNWGDEVHAETSRLFIRAKSKNCRRVKADNAAAMHSARREIENPSFVFSTAGFPRESSWVKSWEKIYKGADSIDKFPIPRKNFDIQLAIHYRKQHLLALFLALPMHVSLALGVPSKHRNHPWAHRICSSLPTRSRSWCVKHPAGMIEDALRCISIL